MAELSIVKSEPLPLTLVKSVPEAPQERSFADAVANAGEKFWEWTGKPVALALGMGSGTDQERGAKAREAQDAIVKGITNEPARVRQELTNALDAFVAGNPRATMHHVLTAVPLVGEGINQAAQEFNKGDISSGIGHTAAMMFPAAAAEGPTILRGAKAVGGAMRDVAATVLPERIPTPEGTLSPAMTHRVGRWVAGKLVPGGGLAYDLVRDLAKGAEAAPQVVETPGMILARESGQDWAKLSAEDRGMLESVAKAQANAAAQPTRPPMGPPQAPSAAAAARVRIRALLPPAPNVIVPEAPVLPPDPSFVRAVPAQYPDVIPPGSLRTRSAAATDLAQQLEASMRAEAITDYVVRKQIPTAIVEQFGPEEWRMIADQAGVQPPTAENIAAIRDNLAEYEGASQITGKEPAKTSAEAAAEFEQKNAIRNRRKPKDAAAAPADIEGQLTDSLAAVEAGQRPAAQVVPEVPAKPTASDARVEAYAQHFASDPAIEPGQIEPMSKLPDFWKLGKGLNIEGSLAPGEAAKIAARVEELRAAAPVPPAIIESDVKSTPAVGQTTGEQSGSARAPLYGSREPTNPVARGSATSVRVPGERTAYEGQYSVRELDDVHASHNAHTFEKNPNYQLRNDRDYSNPVNKERVVVNSKGDTFDPAYVLADSPDATNGAPVIDADGNVIGGNSRAMILDRVYKNNPAGVAAYKAELARKAPQLGINPEQIAGMKRPVLVRELSDTGLNRQRAITDLNKTGTASLTAAERATADARMITPAAADYLASAIDAEGSDATLSEVLGGKSGLGIVNRLVDDGVFTMQERPNLIDPKTGAVTAAAKERISKLLLGQVFEDADQMTRTPAEVRNKLERAVSPILQSGQKAGFDIRPTVRQALDALEYARAHGITRISDLLAQGSMFADAPKFSQQAVDLAQFIRDVKPTEVAKAFRRYVANAEPTMYGESTPAEGFADAFGTQSPPVTLGDLMQPKAAEPPAPTPKPKKPSRRRKP